MTSYERWLLGRRDNPRDPEILRSGKLKTIQEPESCARQLRDWLNDRVTLHYIDTSEAAYRAAENLSKQPLLALDIETTKTDAEHPQAGLNPKLSRIRLIQYCDGTGCFLFDLFRIDNLNWITPLVGKKTVAHNALFEAGHLLHAGISFENIHDSMLMGRVFFNENKALKFLAAEALGLELDKTLQASDWSRPELLREQLEYAAADAVIALELAWIFEDWFASNEAHYRGAYEFLRSLIYPIARQMRHGVPFDTHRHDSLISKWEQQRCAARAQLNIDNPNSNKQKQAWLLEILSEDELLDWPVTKTGNLSTCKDALNRACHIPSAKPLAEFSALNSRLNNFGQKIREQLIDDHLYPGYMIAGMVTGRFSCSNPNIQNIPRSDFKSCFRAPEGHMFVTADLSQIELRVAGILSGDEIINAAFQRGDDLHGLMAAKMSGKSLQEITKTERTAAKAVNFGLLYGAGAETLKKHALDSYGVDLTLERAEEYRDLFFETYPKLHEWQQEIVESTNLQESSESNLIKLTRHYDKNVYTHAMNFPIQSSAWEVLALAILYVDAHALKGTHVSHHVYDELTLLTPESQSTEAAQLLHDAFHHGFHTCFPGAPDMGLVEVGVGRTWEEACSNQGRIPPKRSHALADTAHQ